MTDTRNDLLTADVAWYDTTAAATILGLQPTTLHMWSSMGGGPNKLMPTKEASGRLVWRKSEILRVLAERGNLVIKETAANGE